ncbi:MAG: hypothetical protein DRJ07_13220 [Bacteroidetes bacterium]|nr:MAG: hypothetical protein DRJ07_13220 [Bacteroidota bacterium]
MKKILLLAASIVALAFLLTINITLNSSNGELLIKIDEQVEAADGYIMQEIVCKRGGTYFRCDPLYGSCDVHAQTLCPEPE